MVSNDITIVLGELHRCDILSPPGDVETNHRKSPSDPGRSTYTLQEGLPDICRGLHHTACIPYDDGAAPNPFWGLCTLAICKPRIRRSAKIGDWIVGTGSKRSPIGDIAGQVVYTMCVTRKMKMEEYDEVTRSEFPYKVPHS